MSRTVAGTYESNEQLRNVREELDAKGIPGEKVTIDEDNNLIKVVTADPTAREVEEIFQKLGLYSKH